MLIHLTPRYYAKYSNVQVDIIDVVVPEFKLHLQANIDIVLKTPFPNKNYKVVCRKKGRKAINGVFVETNKEIHNFTVITRWAVNGEVSTHETHYHIKDNEFDAATEEDMLWSGFFNTPYRVRCREIEKNGTSVKRQSTMVTLIGDLNSNDDDSNWTFNNVGSDGIVRFRAEYITLPTVERERLTIPFFGNKRLPSYDDKFEVQVHPYKLTVVPGTLKEFGVYVVPLQDWIRELNEGGEQDLLFQILSEVNNSASFFLSNSNHLEILAKVHSHTYNSLNIENKIYIDSCLNQPVFHVLISGVDEGQKPGAL